MRSTRVRGRSSFLAALASALMPLAGCLQNEGIDPPYAQIAFPVAIELVDATDDADTSPTHLLVANTNFDLSYNAATLQSYDLVALEDALQNACVGAGYDGEQCAIVPEESGQTTRLLGNVHVSAVPGLLASEVRIGSYAEGIAVSPSRRRVYLPVRSDANLTWVEFDSSGRLACGGDPATPHPCDDAHRSSNVTLANSRGITLPIEPLDVHVGSVSDFGVPAAAGDYVAMAHRAGKLSFFFVPNGTEQPELTDVLSFSPSTLVTLTFEAATKRFWMPTGNGAFVHRASSSLEASLPDPRDTQLLRAPSIAITDVDHGTSTASIRQVVLDPRGGINTGRFYAVGSRPNALLMGRVDPANNTMALDAVLPLGSQPTRALFVELGGRMIAFVSCYLGREVYVYDVDAVRLQTIIRGSSGPFEMAVDLVRERLLVTDFRVSVIRVFDLAPLIDCFMIASAPSTVPECAPKALGMLGVPSTVQELR